MSFISADACIPFKACVSFLPQYYRALTIKIPLGCQTSKIALTLASLRNAMLE